MNPSDTPSFSSNEQDQAAFTCYLSAIVAIAKCMSELCPPLASYFGDRLAKLPRRLAFDASPKALNDNLEALESDLADYARAVREWYSGEHVHARQFLTQVTEAIDKAGESEQLTAEMLHQMAERMETSAEVDPESSVRAGLKQYAVALESYARRTKSEKLALLTGLRAAARQLEDRLSQTTMPSNVDPLTGVLNRHEAERQLQLHIEAEKPFSVLLFRWANSEEAPGAFGIDQILKKIATRLEELVRPRDILCRWSTDQFGVFFECEESQALSRSHSIAEWLSGEYSIEPADSPKTKVSVEVAVIEHLPQEAIEAMLDRLDSVFAPAALPV